MSHDGGLPPGVTDQMIEEAWGREPRMPFYVEYQYPNGWDLWAVVDDLEAVSVETRILKDHGFDWRVKDSQGEAVEV